MYEEAEPFIKGIQQRQLKLQRCQSCQKVIFYPRHLCPHDLGQLVYEQIDPSGEIITYSVVERCSEPSLQEKLPYVAALIKLDVGATMFGRITNVSMPLKEALFNKKVQGVFEKQGEEEMIVFELL